MYYIFFPERDSPLVGQVLLLLITFKASWSYSVWHITLSRNPLDKWSAWHTDLYLTTHNTHKRERERERHR